MSLEGYVLQLGQLLQRNTCLLEGTVMLPGEYVTVSDLDSAIVLPNTTAFMRLVAPSGDIVSETASYANPDDSESWAIVDGVWQFTDRITPGAMNTGTIEETESSVDEETEVEEHATAEGTSTELDPCPAGKFRNPATNRCKTIETAVSQLVPCNEGQERNPATNRCRNVTTAAADSDGVQSQGALNDFVPCKAGQFMEPSN